MPELPEVQTVVNQIKSDLLRNKVESITPIWPKVLHNFTSEKAKQKIKDGEILDVSRRAKFIIIKFAKNNLISIKIDAEKGAGPEQKIKYRVRGYPTILVLDSSGNEMDRIVGYRPPEEFLKELIRIKNGENTLSDLQAKYEDNSGDISLQFNIAKKYIDLNVPDSAKKYPHEDLNGAASLLDEDLKISDEIDLIEEDY